MADFGKILQSVGEFGLFQKVLLLALCVPNIILPFHFASVVFVESDPQRHCNTNWILGADPNLTAEEQLNLTLPREEDGTFSRCLMFSPVDWSIEAIRTYGLNKTIACDNGWVYQNTQYEATIVTDFDLVCGRSNLVQVAQTVLMTGVLFGSLLFGPFAESFGRKRATQIPGVLVFIFTAVTGLSPDFNLYLLSQFMVGVGYGGFRMNAIIMATEWIGISKRSWGACVTQVFFAIGLCVMAGVIYFVRDWRLAQLISAAPLGVMAIYIWYIPESARWLLDRGLVKEAREVLKKAAAINKSTIPDSLFQKVVVETETEQKGGILTILKSPVLIKYLFPIILAWFSLNLTYYCLSFNVGNLGLNIFLTQLIFGASELPAHLLCIWLLEAVGRRVCLITTLLTGSLSCLLIIAVGQEKLIYVTLFATLGRIFSNMAGSTCSVYIQELVPTSLRQSASGLGNIANRAGGLLSPVVNMLATYHWFAPITVYSSFMFVSGLLGLLLPETRRRELPDSTADFRIKKNGLTIHQKDLSTFSQMKSTRL
ncbi:solute carrier family 22 member 13 [Boleophthalmus pectinirostris]|uniref:solute carrier family 22 member 13 n=1 Tax=Boleophthalmus pectinirostris TaxID=150288 RepID=UPI000A1C5CE2|nr:solute carrier family 22 member 13 [Boleophthalmus pectinirostris]